LKEASTFEKGYSTQDRLDKLKEKVNEISLINSS